MTWETVKDCCGFKGTERRIATFALAGLLLLTLLAVNSFAGVDMTVFGPKRYDRFKGAPNLYTDSFERCEPSGLALLRVTNGNGKDTTITSGQISINGTVVVNEDDFKQQTVLIEKAIPVTQLNELKVELKSSSRERSFVIVEVIGLNCDSMAPVIFAPSPGDGALLKIARPTIAASYRDEANGSGINPASAVLTLDGTDMTADAAITASGVTYLPSADLAYGEHEATLTVADRAANVSSLVWHFTTDTVPPEFKITSPESGRYLNTPVITVSGNINDETALITLNGTEAQVSGQSFSLSGFQLVEGSNTIVGNAQDPAGNPATDTITVVLDTVPPVISIASPANDSFVNTPRIDVSGMVDDVSTSVTVNGIAAAVSGKNFALGEFQLAEGENVIRVEAEDRAVNQSAAEIIINLDTVAPVVGVTSPIPDSWVNTPLITVSGTVTEQNLEGLWINEVATTVNNGDFSWNNFPLSEGNNQIKMLVLDRAGNENTIFVPVNLDTVLPVVAITAPATGLLTNNAQVAVSGTISEEFTAVTVNGIPAPVTGTNYTLVYTLTEGVNVLTVQAMDRAGNVGSSSVSVTLDSTPPAAPVLAPLHTPTNVATVTVGGTAEAGSTVKIATAAGAVVGTVTADAQRNFSLANVTLAEGTNSFTATATDAALNQSAVSAAVTALLDTALPVVKITSQTNEQFLNTPTVTVSGTLDDPTATVTVNGQLALNTAGGFTLADVTLTEGANTLAAQATDPATNFGTDGITVNLDTVVPVVTINAPLSGLLTNQAQVTVSGTISEEFSAVTVNGIPAPVTGTTFTLICTLAEGANTLTVQAMDRAGNVGSSSVSATLDSTAPAAPVLAPLHTPTNVATVTVGGTAEAGSTVKISTAAGAVVGTVTADAQRNFSLANVTLSEGTNSFTATATDAAVNQSAVSAAVTALLDTALPVVKITSQTNEQFLNTPTVTVSGTLDDPTALVTVNGTPAVVAGNTFSLAGVTLTEGGNTVTALATDPAGNIGTDGIIIINLDTQIPTVTITVPAPGFLTSSHLLTVTGGISEEFSAVTVNGIPAAVTGKTFTLVYPLSEGANILDVRATDRAGNAGSASVTGTLDSTPPAAPEFTSVPSPTKTGSVTLSGNTEGKATVKIFAGATPLGTVSADAQGNFTLPNVTMVEGSNSFSATATDLAGNESNASQPLAIILDTQAPQLAVSTLATGSYTNNVTLNISGTALDNVGLHELQVNGSTVPVNADGSYSHAYVLQDGANTVDIVLTDRAGNQASDSRTITLDQTLPVLAIATPADNSKTKNPILEFQGSVDNEAVITLKVKDTVHAAIMDGLNFTAAITAEYGYNTIEITAVDLAGNKSTVKRTVIFDDKQPSLAVTDPGQDIRTKQGSMTIKGTAGDELTAVTVGIAIDGQNFTPPVVNGSFEQAVSFSAEKSYAVVITATDEVGMTTIVQRNIIYDITPPALTIAPVTTPTNQASQVLTGTMEAGATVSITSATASVGAVSYPASGTWSAVVSNLSVDANDISVQASDETGNTSSVSASIFYDITAPTGAIAVNTGATVTGDAPVQLQLNSTDTTGVTAMRLSSDGLTWTDPTTFAVIAPWSLGAGDGIKQIYVQYQDLAGNWSEAFSTTITLDTTAPVISVATPVADSFANSAQVTVSGTVNEPVSSVTVNGMAASVMGLGWSLPYTLSEDTNTFTVNAVDLAGNPGTSTVSVTLDTRTPVVTINAPAAGLLTRNPQVTVSGTVSEEFTTVTVNTVPAIVTGMNWTLSYTLTETGNTLNVKATDRAGNIGSSAVSVTLDSIAPVAPVLAAPATPTKVAVLSLSGTAEAMATVKVFAEGVLIGSVAADAQGSFGLADVTLTEGANSFTASAIDSALNESLTSLPVTAILDTAPPVITVTAPTENTFFSAPQISVTGSLNEAAALTANGQPVTLQGMGFEQALTLTPGLNSITLVATDLAGNSATRTVLVTLDSTPPVVTITAPVSGGITKTAQVTVAGTVSKANTTATINGATVTVTDKTFSFIYTLQEGDNTLSVEATDRAGNRGSAAVAMTLDTQLPVLSLQTVTEAAAGSNVAIALSASDNNRLTLVELKADGVPIWSGGNTQAVAEAVSYRLSPSLSAGGEMVLQARGTDSAGNEGSASATIRITQAAMGPGYLQGKVLDDARGLRMAGASVAVTDAAGATTNLASAGDGGYFAETAAGGTIVTVTRPGYTAVQRMVAVLPEKKATAIDARLTKISASANLIDAAGGSVRAEVGAGSSRPAVELNLPAGALAVPSDLRLTPVSNQGLAGLLPLGWSPLAVVDLRLLDPTAGTPLDGAFAAAATLKYPITPSLLASDAVVTLAAYDSGSHQWQAKGSATLAADGLSASAEIQGAGQYALVVADAAPNAPQAAAAGNPLAAATAANLSYDAVTAQGKVVPQAAPPATGLKAAGEVVLTAKEGATPAFISGLLLNSRIKESFDLKSGDTVESPSYTQDIVLYRYPCLTSIGAGALSALDAAASLRTTFPVSPSKDYSIVELLLGKVGLDITIPEATETGVMVGADGGRLVDADGNILAIPQGALAQTTPVSTRNGAAAVGAVGADFTLLKVVEVNLTSQTLAQGAVLSIAAPASVDASLPLVLARQIDVKGVARLKLVALARQSGSLISSDSVMAGITLPGITTSANYYFLQAKGPIGFVAGTITDAADSAYTGALVKTDKGSLVDLSTATGKYLVAAPVAPITATAIDLYKNDEVSGSGAVSAANQAITLDLKVLIIPPTVVSVAPNGVNVQPNAPVVATFSKSVDKNSVSSATLKLTDADGNVIPGVFTFSVDGKVVTFSSTDLLKSEKSYTVTLDGAIKDLQGYSLGTNSVSSFTVRKTTPPPMPAAGAVSGTFPDADGFITVSATQGSAEAGNTVLIINDATGETASATPLSNGSFTGRIRAQLGDQIQVVLMDHSGNQTLISYITFKSDDGKYLVTAKGGRVEGEGGSVLEIPDGALSGPAVIKVTAVAETDLARSVPEKSAFLGAFNIDTGGVNFQEEVHLSIPVPAGFDPATTVFVAKPRNLNGEGSEQVYEVIDSTKVINGRITTASPPFEGIVGIGTYVFLGFADLLTAVVSGTTYQERNGESGYQRAPTEMAQDELLPNTDPRDRMYKYDRPIQGAIIRSPEALSYVAYSKGNGAYATFSFLELVPDLVSGSGTNCERYRVVAVDPRTMFDVKFDGFICAPPFNAANVNFKLADKDTIPPDRTAPVIDMSLELLPDQAPENRIVAGTTLVGTKLTVKPLSVVDQDLLSATLTIRYEEPGATAGSDTSIPLDLSGDPVLFQTIKEDGISIYLNKYAYHPRFNTDQGNYFTPALPGYYTFIVEAKDKAQHVTSRSIRLRVVNVGTGLGSSVDGRPQVDSIIPPDEATDVSVTTPITVTFNEPVQNVTAFDDPQAGVPTFSLYDLSDPLAEVQVPASVITSIGGGLMQATLIPKSNLSYGKKYKVSLTTGIKDTQPNQSVATGDRLLNMADSVTSTFKTKSPTGYELASGPMFDSGRDVDIYSFDNSSGTKSTYAYVAAGAKGWRTVDVTDPTAPKVLFPEVPVCDGTNASSCYSFPGGFSYRSVAVHPNQKKALMGMTENISINSASQYGYIRFYDLSRSPEKPTLIGMERLSDSYSGVPGKVVLYGDYALVSTAITGIQIVNIESAKKHKTGELTDFGAAIVGVIDTTALNYGSPLDIAVFNEHSAIFTTNFGHLVSVDLNLPTDWESVQNNAPVLPFVVNEIKPPVPVPAGQAGTAPSPDVFFRIAAAPEYPYTSQDGTERVIDLAVVSTVKGLLYTVDLTNPAEPVFMGWAVNKNNVRLDLLSPPIPSARDISINKQSGLAFVTTFSSILVIDIKDPWNPRLINEIPSVTSINSSGTKGTVSFADTQAIVENNGWVFQANQNKGFKVLDLNLTPACIGGVNCIYGVERVFHQGQYVGGNSTAYTDTYQTIPFTLDRPTRVKVALLDKTNQLRSVVIPEQSLAIGEHSFVIDYETVRSAGFSSKELPDYAINISFSPEDNSTPYKEVVLGRISERTDGQMLGQTIVHDVMIQDGALHLSRQDFAFKGRGPQLAFTRSYSNELSPYKHRPLGEGWSHSLDMRLLAISSEDYGDEPVPEWVRTNRGKFFLHSQTPPVWTSVQVHDGTVFKKIGDTWKAPRGLHGTLTANAGNSFLYTAKDGTRYSYGYPVDTKTPVMVQSVEDRNGNKMTFSYDKGRLDTVTDAVNRSCKFTYDFLNICDKDPSRLMSVTCSGEVEVLFSYNVNGNLNRVSRGDRHEEYAYAREKGIKDGDFNLVKTTDANGNSFNYDYFGKDELPPEFVDFVRALKSQKVVKSVIYPDGPIAAFAYQGGAKTRTVTDLRGNVTTYTLNNYGNPTRVDEPLGKTTLMTWSIDAGEPDNVMLSRKDGNGKIATYAYDAKGNIVTETDPYSHAITTTWDQAYSLPLTRTDRNNVTQRWQYDVKGNLTHHWDGDNKLTQYGYHSVTGDRTSMTDPRNFSTSYSYDQWGNTDLVTGAEASVTDYDYDIRGRLASVIDPNLRKTSYAYDNLDNQTAIAYPPHDASNHAAGEGYNLPSGSTATKNFSYDDVGNLLTESDRTGLQLSYAYTPRNQVMSIKRASGGTDIDGTKTFGYDNNGNLSSESDWKGGGTTHTYDALNRRDSTKNRLNHTMQMGYDLNGNLTSVTDYEQRVTQYQYDDLNRLIKTIQPLLPGQQAPGELNYSYFKEADPKTNLQTETDQEGNLTSYLYNGRYQRTKRTDAAGGIHVWGYDDAGNLLTENDEEGRSTNYTYDRQNRLTQVDRPLQSTVKYAYDPAGNRTSVLDPLLHETVTAYDEWNRPWRVTDPEGNKVYSELDGEGREIRSTDGNNVSRTKMRNSLGQVVLYTDGEGKQTSFSYDANGNTSSILAANGTTTENGFDAEDRPTTSKEWYRDELGGRVERIKAVVSRDKMGNPLQVSDFNGNIATSEYNALNLPSKACDPAPFASQCTETEYFKTGKVKSVKDRRGSITWYEYDEMNRPKIVTDPLGQTVITGYLASGAIVSGYDKLGNVRNVTDKRGVVTSTDYDELYRPKEKKRAGVRLASYEYDVAGNKTAEIDANGNRIEYQYFKNNWLKTAKYPLSSACPSCNQVATRGYSYDGAGNLKAENDELGKTTSYGYDLENRRNSVAFAGETTRTVYDAVGNVVGTIKLLNNGRAMVYDGFNRLASVTDGSVFAGGVATPGAGLATRYEYDLIGNLRHQYGPGGDHTEYVYNALNRKTGQIQHLPDESSTNAPPTIGYVYDQEGNLTQTTDAKGNSVNHVYDELNRLTDSTYPGNVSPYLTLAQTHTEYDENNNITAVTETKSDASDETITDTTTNVYDDFDRLASSTQRGVQVSYGYDNNGNRTSVTTPNGATSYSYDQRNRLWTATVGDEETEFSYRPDGMKESVSYSNGTESGYSYFNTNRIKGISNKSGTAPFSSYSYQYDANGNRTKQVELQNGLTWTTTYGGADEKGQPIIGYDTLDRLMSFTVSAGVRTTRTEYGYEGYNRKTENVANILPVKTIVDGREVITYEKAVLNDKVYSYDSLNRLTGVVDRIPNTTVAYAYDANGNTIQKTDSNFTAAYADTFFEYDSLNRLVQSKRGTMQGGNLLGLYDYDANNMRIRHRNSDRGDVDYYYDGNSVIEERNSTDDSLLARYSYTDQLMALVTASGSQYYHHDALGSTVNLTDGTGAVQAGYVLDPWGHVVRQEGESVNRQIFTGQEHDSNTGLVYFGQRYYDPDTGRFVSQDSYLGKTDTPPSLHRYLYAYSNPTVYIDLEGYLSWKSFDPLVLISKGLGDLSKKVDQLVAKHALGAVMTGVATAAKTALIAGKGIVDLPMNIGDQTVEFAKDRKLEKAPLLGAIGKNLGVSAARVAEDPSPENLVQLWGATGEAFLTVAPFMPKGPSISSRKGVAPSEPVITIESSEGNGINYLYRGVSANHPELANAKKGIVKPGDVNGTVTPEQHNSGGVAAESPFTSWTRDPRIAVEHSAKEGQGGVVLRVPQGAPPPEAPWNWEWSPDKFSEQEVLLRGVRTDVEVSKP